VYDFIALSNKLKNRREIRINSHSIKYHN